MGMKMMMSGMRRNYTTLGMLLMLLMLASCGKDDNPAYQDATDPVDSLYRVILGDWKLEQETRVVGQDTIRKYSVLPTLTFFANGTYKCEPSFGRFYDQNIFSIKEETEEYFRDNTGPIMFKVGEAVGVYYKYFIRVGPDFDSKGRPVHNDFAVLIEDDKMYLDGVHVMYKVSVRYVFRKVR